MLDQPLSERLRAAREAQEAPATAAALENEPEKEPEPELPDRLPLGRLLIEKGMLSEADLELALGRQREDGRPIGQILLEMGVVSQGDLARTLTEQHGFDFSGSLRRRLASVDDAGAAPGRAASEPTAAEPAAEEPAPVHDERYLVRASSIGDPLHVAESFLDAADAAFELIEERDPEQLEIVRCGGGQVECLWSYRRDEAGTAPPAA